MEPNQNVNSAQRSATSATSAVGATVGAPSAAGGLDASGAASALNAPETASTSDKSGDDVVFRDKPKRNTGMILGMVLLGILAVGGIAFGVWEMMDGNKRVDDLNNQISTLKTQNSELADKVNELKESHSEMQTNIAGNQEAIEEMQEEALNEEGGGYRVLSIGDCVSDGGTTDSTLVVKCDVETSVGAGKFVYDSESNTLKLVLN